MNLFLVFLASLYLSYNFNDGSLLVLSDGSKWKISPNDTAITELWLVPMEIEIENSNDTRYPFLLKNLQTKQQVKAEKLAQ